MEEQKPKKKRRLTVKQQKFVQEVASGKSLAESVVRAGYDVANRDSASSMGVAMMNKPHIQEKLTEAIERVNPQWRGMIADFFMGTLKDGEFHEKLAVADRLIKLYGENPVEVKKNLNLSAKIPTTLLPEE